MVFVACLWSIVTVLTPLRSGVIFAVHSTGNLLTSPGIKWLITDAVADCILAMPQGNDAVLRLTYAIEIVQIYSGHTGNWINPSHAIFS